MKYINISSTYLMINIICYLISTSMLKYRNIFVLIGFKNYGLEFQHSKIYFAKLLIHQDKQFFVTQDSQ